MLRRVTRRIGRPCRSVPVCPAMNKNKKIYTAMSCTVQPNNVETSAEVDVS